MTGEMLRTLSSHYIGCATFLDSSSNIMVVLFSLCCQIAAGIELHCSQSPHLFMSLQAEEWLQSPIGDSPQCLFLSITVNAAMIRGLQETNDQLFTGHLMTLLGAQASKQYSTELVRWLLSPTFAIFTTETLMCGKGDSVGRYLNHELDIHRVWLAKIRSITSKQPHRNT